jgi:hypothetical protein
MILLPAKKLSVAESLKLLSGGGEATYEKDIEFSFP